MTLTDLRIANFKAFSASQRVPLRPITLMYGANSSGKSTVLHALAFAHHAIETGDLDTRRTQIGGDAVDLGGFRQFVHRREGERQVEMGFKLDPRRLSGRGGEHLRGAREAVVEVAIGLGFTSDQFDLFGDRTRKLDRDGGVRLERFDLRVDGSPLLSMSTRAGGKLLRLDRLHRSQPVFRRLIREIQAPGTGLDLAGFLAIEEDSDALGEVLDGIVPAITARSHGLIPRVEEEVEIREKATEPLAQEMRLFLPRALRDLIGSLGTALEDEIRRLLYLGPLRSFPPRHLAFSQQHDPNWFAGGGYAWDAVRTQENVLRRVNKWLGDVRRMQTAYELRVRDLLPAEEVSKDLRAKLPKAMHDLAASLVERFSGEGNPDLEILARDLTERIADINPDDPADILPEIYHLVATTSDEDEMARRWADEMIEARPEALQDIVLVDKRTGTEVSHRDVGIGVSQVLPVLVSAYASKNRLLAIEQPEIHLHPALQAELGDVFLESALGGNDNTCLIETHSEHLLLRIMRRIRETSTGSLPDGMPAVRPDDVMVLFVEADGPQSIIREMPLNERGELIRAWPGGFFEEGLRELF